MNKRRLLKLFFGGMFLSMVYLVVATSLKSNLFEVLPTLSHQPWFMTTLVDFYFNIAIISAWVVYKEKSFLAAALWIVSFICLGSITTCLYIFIQLIALKDKDSFDKVLLRKA